MQKNCGPHRNGMLTLTSVLYVSEREREGGDGEMDCRRRSQHVIAVKDLPFCKHSNLEMEKPISMMMNSESAKKVKKYTDRERERQSRVMISKQKRWMYWM